MYTPKRLFIDQSRNDDANVDRRHFSQVTCNDIHVMNISGFALHIIISIITLLCQKFVKTESR